jgi:hypothetical protein
MTLVWTYVRADGRIIADSDFKCEDDAWRIVLGWPHPDEIDAAKARGDTVVQMRFQKDSQL